MTDKQIIIDKYPDCEYYNFSLGGICEQTTLSGNGKNCAKCSDINGCFIKEHYKQLKRKEQECEKKDKDIKYLIKCLVNSFRTQHNSELYWERERKKLKAENERFKQSLTEIKEIAEEDFNHTCWETYARQLKQILQKISEVENAK